MSSPKSTAHHAGRVMFVSVLGSPQTPSMLTTPSLYGVGDDFAIPELPPRLHDALIALEESGWAAEIYDAEWRLRWVSPELRLLLGAKSAGELALGRHLLEVYTQPLWRDRVHAESHARVLNTVIKQILSSAPESLEGIDEEVRTMFAPAIAEARRDSHPVMLSSIPIEFLHSELPPLRVRCLSEMIYDERGEYCGVARIYGPALRASILSLVARGNEGMFERMSKLVSPQRQRVAMMFCDIEGSVDLSRRLPSQVYFDVIAATLRRVDDIVISSSGIVGKHAGDGASAFFLADDHGDVSGAAKAAILAARKIREQVPALAHEVIKAAGISDVGAIQINVGLHFSATVYIGQMITGGRLEVTALGDQVNACARLEAAASGGSILAAKELIERLGPEDAKEVGINVGSQLYRPLHDIDGVSSRVLSEIGQMPVCEL